MGHLDCSDVCEIVIDNLLRLGFTKKQLNLIGDDPDHKEIIEALGHVQFVRADFRQLREAYHKFIKVMKADPDDNATIEEEQLKFFKVCEKVLK